MLNSQILNHCSWGDTGLGFLPASVNSTFVNQSICNFALRVFLFKDTLLSTVSSVIQGSRLHRFI